MGAKQTRPRSPRARSCPSEQVSLRRQHPAGARVTRPASHRPSAPEYPAGSKREPPRQTHEQQQIWEMHRRAVDGAHAFSDSESDASAFSDASDDKSSSDPDSDPDSDSAEEAAGGALMILPSALDPLGRKIRKVTTDVVDDEEQLLLAQRRARAARTIAQDERKSAGLAYSASRRRVEMATARNVEQNQEYDADHVTPRDFQCIKVIGVGGMGRVVLVRHRRDEKLYAMKVVSKRSVREKDMASKILSERDVLGGTHHHSLVHLHWAFQTKSRLYFVMDYCPGGELSTHLEHATRFKEEVAAFYAAELLLALEHLHQHGIVHRDLKPENVLLTADGHLKLVDFGISKFGITEATSGAKTLCGSYEYLAPEMLRGEEYGTAVDWWAFGVVLYELLTGLPPWYNHSPDVMRKRVLSSSLSFPNYISQEAKDLLRRLLNKNPSQRLGSRRGSWEIKQHVFFCRVDWDEIMFHEHRPPIQPCAAPQAIEEASNFRTEFTRMSVGSVDSSSGSNALSQSFTGFDFEAPMPAHASLAKSSPELCT